MKTHLIVFVAALLGGLSCSAEVESREADREPLRPEAIYKLAKQAAVEVLVDDRLEGSGCFISADGYIATAAHILPGPGRRFEVLTAAGDRHDVDVIAVDEGHDVAILKARGKGPWKFISLSPNSFKPGQKIFQFGTPIFRHWVMQPGTVARDGLTYEYYGEMRQYIRVWHVSGTQQKGTSGGPWLDAEGRFCGVQSGIMIVNGALQGISFVAPVDVVRALLNSKTHATTPSLRIAVEETWQQPRSYLKKLSPRTEGLVAKVLPEDGPSAKAGLPQDALIRFVDGKPARLPDDFLDAVRMKRPGEEVQLVYQVPGEIESKNIAITLERLEQKWLPKAEK